MVVYLKRKNWFVQTQVSFLSTPQNDNVKSTVKSPLPSIFYTPLALDTIVLHPSYYRLSLPAVPTTSTHTHRKSYILLAVGCTSQPTYDNNILRSTKTYKVKTRSYVGYTQSIYIPQQHTLPAYLICTVSPLSPRSLNTAKI